MTKFCIQGRTLIVTDIEGEEVQQLVVYQDNSLIQSADQMTPDQISHSQIVAQSDSQLLDQESQLIDTSARIIEQQAAVQLNSVSGQGNQVQQLISVPVSTEDGLVHATNDSVAGDGRASQ